MIACCANPSSQFLQRDSDAGTLKTAITKFHLKKWNEPDLHKLLARFQRVCEAMAYAHSRGIIHRDLKPEKVMLGEFGETMEADWGLAQLVDSNPANQTGPASLAALVDKQDRSQSQEISGTPQYMSPEQAQGEKLGPGSDIYSLGATLYCMLTGQNTLSVKSADRIVSSKSAQTPWIKMILERVANRDWPDPRRVNPRIPRSLQDIVLKAMAPLPEQRYKSALELSNDVQNWIDDEELIPRRDSWGMARLRSLRKHRKLASGVLGTTALASLAIAGVVWASNQELDAANLQLTQRRNQLQLATERLETTNKQLDQSNQTLTTQRNDLEIAGKKLTEANRDIAKRNLELQNEQTRLQHALEIGFHLLKGIEQRGAWTIDDAYSDILRNGLRLPVRWTPLSRPEIGFN